MNVPFFKQFQPDLLITSLLHNPWTYPLAFVLFLHFHGAGHLAGASNAVNLTDGLDGLAIGLMIIAAGRDDGPDLRQRARRSSRSTWIWRDCPARRS